MVNKQRIQELLMSLGANKTYLGFDYLTEGILKVWVDRTCLAYITKGIYWDIATRHKTEWKCIERNMRTVVRLIWEHGNRELLEKIAGRKLKKRPRNGEFMEMIVDYLNEQEEAAATRED